ncbi:ATP-binding protein [Streptomyces sp. NPDC059900]|uniref:ATP-binding protein n=1 Tax=Streptomyces sp. NPDC059900 TaxID=3155816 RepID=UPI00342F7718
MRDDAAPPDEPATEHAGSAAAPEFAFELDGTSTCIARARQLAAGFLARMQSEHGVAVSRRATDLTQLVISELVTNALKYAPGPVLVKLRIDAGAVEVAVRDSGPDLPRARAADTGRVGQHGLEIVLAVARRFEARQEEAGKSITVSITLDDT